VTVVGRGLTIYLNVTTNTCVRGALNILIHSPKVASSERFSLDVEE
jgi:hypothetical protein